MMTISLIAASVIPMVIGVPLSQELSKGLLQADAKPKTIVGKLYPIVEQDALEEIEARVKANPYDPKMFSEEDDWSALQSSRLPMVSEYRLRQVIPFFALSFDIPDKDGNILYPASYTFNPLEHLRLPSRLIIVDERQLAWGIKAAKTGDMILLAGANPLKASRQYDRVIFKLEDQIRERLSIERVPSIVEQHGSHFIIEEIVLNDSDLILPLDDLENEQSLAMLIKGARNE